jgi:hypothetical protein
VLTILDTAHVYYPHLSTKVLEVREHTEGASHLAFLQARDPVTLYNCPDWELVASGRSDGRDARGQDRSVRLAALKNLQETVEKQGMFKQIWSQWEGSHVLDQDA